ncbi:MAG: ABC transporter permease [SAR324 cluster bacterium]|nr:ABC transporter permease [SAR324 cluster bacterium]
MKKEKVYKKPAFWFFSIPPVGWYGVFMLMPLIMLWAFSFGSTNEQFQVVLTWTTKNYLTAFQPIYLKILLKTILFSALATAICLVIGFFVALYISFSSPQWKPFWLILVILPFWTNLLIRVFGVSTMLSNSGMINKLLEFFWNKIKILEEVLGWQILSGDYFEPYDMLYNYGAVVAGMVYVSLPFMILPIYSSLDKLDISYLEASLDLGASHTRTIFKIMIPMIMPGIGFGIFLTFIPSLSTFLIPDMLGGPNAQMIANVIQRQFGAGSNWPLGAALSFILMYITFAFFFGHMLYGARRDKR